MTEGTKNQNGKAEGERETPEELLSLLYDDLRRLAAARMAQEPGGQTLQATALVHEAWLALTRSKDQTWKDRAHFFGAAAEAMRRVLVDNARRKSRQKRGGGQERLNIEEVEVAGSTPEEKLLLIDEALERFEKEDPEKAHLVLLKFFGGLTNQEVATRFGVTERTVERNWAFARARLFCMIRKEL
jgi:RNA polymerase sigma factor (TIGR02999 family)